MIPSTGKIDRLLVELRPRLQCANFFLSFPRRFADLESTTIELATDRITIVMKGERERYEIRTGDFFQLHTQTLSSLVIKNRYICFRVNTNEAVFGSERLQNGAGMGTPGEREVVPSRLTCTVVPGKRYHVLCGNCDGPLVQDLSQPAGEEGIIFKRVLELPSEQLDTDDWFCHRHDHAHGHGGELNGGPPTGEQQDLSTKLEPQQCDLFYGPFYALLHRSVLQRVHIRHDRFVYCKRCLRYLGTTRTNRPSVKLWSENVRFHSAAEESTVPVGLFPTDDALELFHQLVRKTVREFNFVTHLGLPPTIKLLFELRRPGPQGEVFYLLMQIMDCQLSVFRATQERSGTGSECESDSGSSSDDVEGGSVCPSATKTIDRIEEPGHDEDDDDDDVFIERSSYRVHTIRLERHRAMKLLYRYEKFDEQPLFTFWREDSNVVNLELSEPMFSAAIRYLDANANYVPECYRVNLGFSMSYLDIS